MFGFVKRLLGRRKVEPELAPLKPGLEMPTGLPELERTLPAVPTIPTSAAPPIAERPSALAAESGLELKREFELVNAKLDALKAMLEGLSHRLEKLEEKEKKEVLRW